MITFFQDYDTDGILSSLDIDIAPSKNERVMIDGVWYVVVERTFHIGNHPHCAIYVKEEEQKPRWTEEDVEIVSKLQCTLNHVDYDYDTHKKLDNWLKSIEQRMDE